MPTISVCNTLCGHLVTIKYILVLIIFSKVSFGQTCDTLVDKRRNHTDSNGLKQGYWLEKQKVILSTSYSGLGSAEGCIYSENANYFIAAEGCYLDNKRIGKWQLYNNNTHLISVDREITYFPNDSICYTEIYKDLFINYNRDSTIITGSIKLPVETVYFNCKNQQGELYIEPKHKIIVIFPFKEYFDFETQLAKLQFGRYTWTIRELQNVR